MQFFSGFSLKNEEHFFENYIDKSFYNVCGFSYGAIKALQYTQKELSLGNRIDRLQLFSPAFFQTKSTKFKRLQLLAYIKSETQYLKQFLEACFSPYKQVGIDTTQSSKMQLEELLNYEWNIADFLELEAKGVSIEVYLGEKDAIIDINAAREFFLELSTVTYIKNANHFLQTKEGK